VKLLDQGGRFVAENAAVTGRVTLAAGVSIWYAASVRGDLAPIRIGECTNIQDGSVLHCDPGKDLVVGSHVTVGHLAMIHAKEVGDRCLIGIHSTILSGAVIGEGSIIAAGALVRENQVIPPRSIVLGLPGKVVGQVTDAQWEEAKARALRYLGTARRHAEGKADPSQMAEYGGIVPEK
jgi:carbonic anhydrase/acetyltransferase-like protein (isoleucine patch superfamily)